MAGGLGVGAAPPSPFRMNTKKPRALAGLFVAVSVREYQNVQMGAFNAPPLVLPVRRKIPDASASSAIS